MFEFMKRMVVYSCTLALDVWYLAQRASTSSYLR